MPRRELVTLGPGDAVDIYYETLLVAGEFEPTVDALEAAEFQVIVAPVGPARMAIIADGWWHSDAEVDEIVTLLSRDLGFPVIRWENDSEVLTAGVWEHGRRVHWYESDQSKRAFHFKDINGHLKLMLGSAVYPADTPITSGPTGDDPAAFLPFGIGTVDVERLAGALRGEVDHEGLVQQHRAILQALNLDPLPLTEELSYADLRCLPGAVLTEPAISDAARAAIEESIREFVKLHLQPNR